MVDLTCFASAILPENKRDYVELEPFESVGTCKSQAMNLFTFIGDMKF